MAPLIVGVCGLARAGKDTFINTVVNAYPAGTIAVDQWAAPVKAATAHIFDLTREHVEGIGFDREAPYFWGGLTVRDALRDVGMLGRKYDPDFWVDKALARIDTLSAKVVLMSGTRFMNELTVCDASVWIHRPGLEADDHPSETSLDPWDCDDVILNTGDLEDLDRMAQIWARRALGVLG